MPLNADMQVKMMISIVTFYKEQRKGMIVWTIQLVMTNSLHVTRIKICFGRHYSTRGRSDKQYRRRQQNKTA